VLVSYLRPEEKSILAAARDRGIEVAPIFDRNLVLDLSSPHAPGSGLDFDVVLDRCVAHSRSGYTLRALRRWGIPTLNDAEAVRLCDDKAENSLVLGRQEFPRPAR
jgi:[lysine-biosynthesis-protein LysW]--L-2-aminoadipate ligase